MKVFLNHDKGLHFSITNPLGFHVPIDAAKAIGGTEEGFRPMELVLGALISCTSIDVVLILNKYRKRYEGYRVESAGERREEIPNIFTDIQLVYKLSSTEITAEQFFRAVDLALTKYCSVSKMLIPEVKITARVELNGTADSRIISV